MGFNHSILLPRGMPQWIKSSTGQALNSTGPVLTDSGRYKLFSPESLGTRKEELIVQYLGQFTAFGATTQKVPPRFSSGQALEKRDLGRLTTPNSPKLLFQPVNML